jgi:hypothetical protein
VVSLLVSGQRIFIMAPLEGQITFQKHGVESFRLLRLR